MWIFAKSGFYSIVQSRTKPGKLELRARCLEDLHNLRIQLGSNCRIYKTEDRDYLYRVYLDDVDACRLFTLLMNSIDYYNFKDAVLAADDSVSNSIRCRFYERVWS